MSYVRQRGEVWRWTTAIILLATWPAAGEEQVSTWRGYERVNFTLEGRPCFLTRPKIAAPGRPWVWRTSFPDFHAEVDLELLHHGWHVGFINCVEMLGADPALDLMDRFYDHVTRERGLAPRPALEAVSRGGLHAYRYAARHPRRIACIYADTPVMTLASWPREWPAAGREWAAALKHYGFADEAAALAYRGNPLDQLAPLAQARLPLRHVISLNDKVVPPEQNTLEARRRLEQLGHTLDVVTVAAGTEESHGHHFPLPEVFASARFIMQHSCVLPGDREYFQLRAGLANCLAKFQGEKSGRVAFLGGSITHNPGWRDELMRYLQQRFPETRFEFVAAGIPSLGSVAHAFRLEQDVLARGPLDLLLVEAAVNDHNYDTLPNPAELALRGMEGVVRHARAVNPRTDIVLMHFVSPSDLADYAQGRVPRPIAQHERVAEQYGCASLELAREVADRIRVGQFTWKDDFRDVHPPPFGQRLYANSMTRLLDAAFGAAAGAQPRDHALPERPLDERSYAAGRFGKVAEARIVQGFQLDANWNPRDGAGTRPGFVNVPALVGTRAGDELEFEFEGTGCGLLVVAGPRSGRIEFRVDDGPVRQLDTYSPWSGNLHLPWPVILDDGLPPGKHVVRVRIAPGHHPKSQGTQIVVTQLLLN